MNPSNDVVVAPLQELVGDENPPNYEPMTFKQYRSMIRRTGVNGKSYIKSRAHGWMDPHKLHVFFASRPLTWLGHVLFCIYSTCPAIYIKWRTAGVWHAFFPAIRCGSWFSTRVLLRTRNASFPPPFWWVGRWVRAYVFAFALLATSLTFPSLIDYVPFPSTSQNNPYTCQSYSLVVAYL